jgi:tetratricopeptide (TPR) repeat protein
VQAIAWIPGRNDSLLTAFALASMIFLIQYFETRRWIHIVFHLLFFFLSLLTKENAVLLPVLYFFCRKIFNGKKIVREAVIKKEFSWIIFIISWSLIGGFFFTIRSQVLGSSVGLPLNFTIENLFKNLPALIQYTGKMLLPFSLSTFPILQDTSFVYGIISCGLLIYFLIRSKNIRRNYLLLGVSWFILFLIPAIIRTSSDYESVFLEHRIYFPLIGFILLCLETDLVKKLQVKNAISWTAVAALFTLFIILSFNHSSHYKNELSYWSRAISTSPHASFAHRGFGTSLMAQGKSSDAEKEYLQALELNPDLKEVRNNLGRIYLNEGQNEKAEQKFNEEIKINPANAVAYYNLGLLRLSEKKVADAESMMRRSLQLDPDYLDAQNDLCVILATGKKYDEAVQLCIHILESNPSYESARKNLSLIFSAWQNEEKINYYNKILKEKGLY